MKTRAKALEKPKKDFRLPDFKLLDLYGACVENAQALIGDAKLLLANQRFAPAYALAYTAIEELGKSQVVADYFYDLVTSAEFEAAFRDHRFKTAYVKRYVAIPDNMSEEWFIEYDAKIKAAGFANRNAALYVEHTAENAPSTPNQAISPDQAAELVSTAESYYLEIIHMAAISERIGTKAFTK